jgi:hypothetical protein
MVQLLDAGHEVIVLDDRPRGIGDAVPPEATFTAPTMPPPGRNMSTCMATAGNAILAIVGIVSPGSRWRSSIAA